MTTHPSVGPLCRKAYGDEEQDRRHNAREEGHWVGLLQVDDAAGLGYWELRRYWRANLRLE